METIYLLSDPRTNQPRYVGVTSRALAVRLRQHQYQAVRGENRPVCDWWRKLHRLGLVPLVTILEETDDRVREAYWIAKYRAEHPRLLNLADGGNYAPSSNPAVAAKIATALRGRKLSPEHLAKCRARPAHKHTEETKAKMRKPKSAKHRENARRALAEKRARGECRVLRGDENPSRRNPERLARGSAQGQSKLTESQVIEMRNLSVRHYSNTEIAAKFGVSQSVVSGIIRGLAWSHLPGATEGPGRGVRRQDLVASGEAHGQAKLRATQFMKIRAAYKAGASQTALSKEFGASLSQIHRIVTGQSWASLPL